MSWFNLTWQLSTTQLCSVTPHCSRMMEEIGKKKVRKHVGWDKSNLMGQKMKINWCIMQLLTTQWPVPSQFPSRGPWPSFLTDTYIYAEHSAIHYGLSPCPVWVTCPGCALAQLLVSLQPSPSWEAEKSLILGEHDLAKTKKINVLSTLFSY